MNKPLWILNGVFIGTYTDKRTRLLFAYLGFFFMASSGCTKSNFLLPGKYAIISVEGGMYLRTEPNINSTKVYLVPNGKEVYVQSEGIPEELYGIRSKWYRVVYRDAKGWMWGGFSKPTNTRQSIQGESPKFKPTLPPESTRIIAWESVSQYCTELYRSPFVSYQDEFWIQRQLMFQASRSDQITIVPKCSPANARSIVKINALKNPPLTSSAYDQLQEKFITVSFDIDPNRQTSNEEYVRLFSSHGALVEVIK